MDEREKLGDAALASLRGALAAASGGGRAAAAVELAAVAGAMGGAVTLDLTATEALGHAVVVVRVPEYAGEKPVFATLSDREREVAALVAQGLKNREIAARLYISVATVKDHVHHILDKTGLAGRAAVAAAWR